MKTSPNVKQVHASRRVSLAPAASVRSNPEKLGKTFWQARLISFSICQFGLIGPDASRWSYPGRVRLSKLKDLCRSGMGQDPVRLESVMEDRSACAWPHADRWLSVDEISAYLGIKRDTVYKWISERQMPGHKIGRLWKFDKREVDEWVKAGGASSHDQRTD